MHDYQLLETMHRQSREAWEKRSAREKRSAWEKRSAQLESQNKMYLIKINQLLGEREQWQLAMDAVSTELKKEMNDALLAATQLRKDNLFLSAHNDHLKEEAAKSFDDAEKALSEAIKISKGWAMSAFVM